MKETRTAWSTGIIIIIIVHQHILILIKTKIWICFIIIYILNGSEEGWVEGPVKEIYQADALSKSERHKKSTEHDGLCCGGMYVLLSQQSTFWTSWLRLFSAYVHIFFSHLRNQKNNIKVQLDNLIGFKFKFCFHLIFYNLFMSNVI